MFGQHWHHPVYQIDRGGSVHRLLVNDRTGGDVVCNIGYMHSHFIVAIGQNTQRQSIVEVFCVFGVYSESYCLAEIFTGGDYFRGYSCVDFIGCFLNVGRIFVWQAVFCQYRMDFCVVFPCFSKYVDNFPTWVFGVVRP